MEKFNVHMLFRIWALLAICGLLAGNADAGEGNYRLIDGQTVTGEVVTMNDRGFALKQGETYSDTIPWGKLTQEDLKSFLENPKAVPFVEPFIEIPVDEKLKRTEVELKEFPRLPRAAPGSLFGALGGSGAGLVILLLLYAANIYAAYEISIFRARPAGLVCGVAAVLPILGPAIFMAMPTYLRRAEEEGADTVVDDGMQAVIAAEHGAPGSAAPAAQHAGKSTTAAPIPAGRSFMRGQFTFNRRFFETQMPSFFAMVRPEAEKDTVLTIKSARGNHIVQRISRISSSDLYVQVQKGHASEEIIIPFVEIQEVHMKHKNAP